MQQLAEKVGKQVVSTCVCQLCECNHFKKKSKYSSNIIGNGHLTAPKPKHILIILQTALGGR